MRTACPAPWPGRVRLPSAMLVLGLAVGGPAVATTIHVERPGTIAAGLAAAAAGDTVLVACGTYREQGLLMPEGVVLRGEAGDPACAKITSTGGQPILSCVGVSNATRIEALTFAIDDAAFPIPADRGGGLYCEDTQVRVTDCLFVGLLAVYGGAVYARDAAPRFMDCDFLENHALAAGGALNAVGSSSPTLETCLLYRNSTAGAGGAVNAALGAGVLLTRCTVVGGDGGTGVLASWLTGESAVRAEHSIVAVNTGAAWAGDLGAVAGFACSDIWGNGADWVGALAGQAGQNDNLAADPAFCGPAAPESPWGLDLASPCADGPCGLIGARLVACDLTTGIDDPPPGEALPVVPETTRLLGNRPNPFNPSTTVSFALRRPGPVRITVFDLAGRIVKRLTDEVWPAGVHELTWRGDDRSGRQAAAGVYFVRLDADGIYDTLRAALVK